MALSAPPILLRIRTLLILEMTMRQFRFSPALTESPPFTIGDGLILLGLATLLYIGPRLALAAPAVNERPRFPKWQQSLQNLAGGHGPEALPRSGRPG